MEGPTRTKGYHNIVKLIYMSLLERSLWLYVYPTKGLKAADKFIASLKNRKETFDCEDNEALDKYLGVGFELY